MSGSFVAIWGLHMWFLTRYRSSSSFLRRCLQNVLQSSYREKTTLLHVIIYQRSIVLVCSCREENMYVYVWFLTYHRCVQIIFPFGNGVAFCVYYDPRIVGALPWLVLSIKECVWCVFCTMWGSNMRFKDIVGSLCSVRQHRAFLSCIHLNSFPRSHFMTPHPQLVGVESKHLFPPFEILVVTREVSSRYCRTPKATLEVAGRENKGKYLPGDERALSPCLKVKSLSLVELPNPS